MSNDIQKADQIAHRFYSKLCLVVSNARTTSEPRSQGKVDKWFNIETPDFDIFKDHLRIYRAVSCTPSLPPFELQVLLSVPELTNNQVLVYLAPDSSRVRIDPTPQYILLENWTLSFLPTHTISPCGVEIGDVAPSTIYKYGIPLFRSLFSLLRMLPSWKLFRKLRRRMSTPYLNGNFSIQLRIKAQEDHATDILDFGAHVRLFCMRDLNWSLHNAQTSSKDSPPAPNTPPLPYDIHTFPSIPHPMGTLSLTAKYLASPHFQLDELESLLSSRFLSLDEGPDFTPTLVKNQQRDSMSALPSSTRASLPKSPPSSIANQFVLPPAHSRTSSLPSSQSPRSAPLPLSRTTTNMATAGSTSALSVASSRPEGSSTWSREDGTGLANNTTRIRRESTSTTGRSSLDLPSAPGALPIRRPNINPVHPFKSSALSSGSPSIHSPSPSLRQPSPLSSGVALPSLPARPTQTSPNSSRVPPSPIGVNRPSPPFAPSSLSDRRSLASAEGDDTSPRIPTRKRYSSSFGHRYAATGGGGATSDGSPGSTAGIVGAKDGSGGDRSSPAGSGTASGTGGGGGSAPAFLGAATDDDDISMFVQEIDARKPLASAVARQSSSPEGCGGPSTLTQSPGKLRYRRELQQDSAGVVSRSGSDGHGGGASAALGLGLVAGEHLRHISEGTSASDAEGTTKASSSTSSAAIGPMLTREAEVDEKLRHMHEVFLASLEGLGSNRRRDSMSGRSVESGSGQSSSGGGVMREGGGGGGNDDDDEAGSRPGSRDGGVLGFGLPSGLGRERRRGSLRSVSAMEAGSSGSSGNGGVRPSRLSIAGNPPRPSID